MPKTKITVQKFRSDLFLHFQHPVHNLTELSPTIGSVLLPNPLQLDFLAPSAEGKPIWRTLHPA